MPATIAAVAAPVAAPAGGAPAPVQTSAGTKAPAEPSKAGPEGTKTPPAEPAKAPEPPRRFKGKYKDNGKDVDVDLDEGEALREIQKARHYDRTRPEAEARERRLQQTIEAIEKDPRGFLKQRGLDLKQLAAEDIAQEAEMAKLSPEARELAEARQQNQELQQQIQQHAQQQQHAQAQAEHQQLVRNTAGKFAKTIEVMGRTRSGKLLKTMAAVEEMAVRAGEPDLSPEQLASAVERFETSNMKEETIERVKDPSWRSRNGALLKELAAAVFGTLDGQELADFVGPAHGAKISKAMLAIYRKNPLPALADAGGQPPAPRPPEPQRERPPSASVWSVLDQLAR